MYTQVGQGRSIAKGSGGGWNGGGHVGPQGDSGAGGGATDIRLGGTSLSGRIIVAGGGGDGYCGGRNKKWRRWCLWWFIICWKFK